MSLSDKDLQSVSDVTIGELLKHVRDYLQSHPESLGTVRDIVRLVLPEPSAVGVAPAAVVAAPPPVVAAAPPVVAPVVQTAPVVPRPMVPIESPRPAPRADRPPLALEDRPSVAELLPRLTLGRSTAPSESTAPPSSVLRAAPATIDFGLVESRCRLKAEAARFGAERRRAAVDGRVPSARDEEAERELIARSRMFRDCILWMFLPPASTAGDAPGYDLIAGCFEAVGDGVALLRGMLDQNESAKLDPEQYRKAIFLLAEAQSALRISVKTAGGPDPEGEQIQVFGWLKHVAAEQRIYIDRHMRLDDPADPTRWPDVRQRIAALNEEWSGQNKRAKLQKKLFGKVRHKMSEIAEYPDGAEDYWRTVAESVHELIETGVAPSHRELRELIRPQLGTLPAEETWPEGFQTVLREIARYEEEFGSGLVDSQEATDEVAAARESAEVEEVRRLLSGKVVVLIGGEARPDSQAALKEAFDLGELVWIETREHQSIEGFKPPIARPETALVILAIRWSSHSFGDVLDHCQKHGKPFVRLPGGYNPNQVAHQILTQVSGKLRVA